MSQLWPLVGIPVLIFLARVLDVSLGTMRIILVSRGMRRIAPLIGFFETLIWLLAISQVVQHLDHVIPILAWSGGYATGTWVGLWLEERIALGLVAVRVIAEADAQDLVEELRTAAFGVTSFAARGVQGRVRLLLSVIRRKDLERFRKLVQATHPKAFVSISDVRSASEGYLPAAAGSRSRMEMLMRRK